MQRHLSAQIVTVVLTTACAGTAGPATPQRQPDVITAEDVAAMNVTTAFEVVERLRPQFLRVRGASSAILDTRITVFQDDLILGGVETLRQIRAADVHEIRYLNASDATIRFGSGHPNGVIAVTSKSR